MMSRVATSSAHMLHRQCTCFMTPDVCSLLQPLPAPSTTTASAVAAAAGGPRKPRKRTGNLEELHHPLLGDEPTLQLLPDRSEVAGRHFINRSEIDKQDTGPRHCLPYERALACNVQPVVLAMSSLQRGLWWLQQLHVYLCKAQYNAVRSADLRKGKAVRLADLCALDDANEPLLRGCHGRPADSSRKSQLLFACPPGLGPDAARKRGGFLSRWFLSRQQPKVQPPLHLLHSNAAGLHESPFA
jgi:hypothetical protein